MKLSQTDFVGTGKVFRFTLTQYVKSKANIISFVVLILICALSAPLSGFLSDTEEVLTEAPDTLYIQNETSLPVRCEKDTLVSLGFTKTRIRTDGFEKLGEKDVLLRFTEADGQLCCRVQLSENSYFADGNMSDYASLGQKLITAAKCEMLGISEDSLAAIEDVPEINVQNAGEIEATEDGLGAQFVLQYVYAILVMMLTLLAASYIIRSVIEEKSSKLVELLMVSVKPLALLSGKILAMMLTVFVTLLSMLLTALLSNLVLVKYFDLPGIGQAFASFGLDFSSINLGWETVLLTVLCVFIAYLTYAVLAGIAGSCCSAMEQADSANTLVILTIMAGYMVSCITSSIPSAGVAYFTSLFPVVSAFCAPVQYAMGNIPLWVFIVSLLIQAAIAYLLIRFCAKVYHGLLIHRGNRVKWRELFGIAKEGSGK